ncbi:unnamed protein product [Polarella glacialis]|uniref:Uncharacterized protein n=1 Tax=Polarella glacialis TaxID=89957 RepID=A0A813K2N1_POLGL|nr:unnamed protein product [Polarella glacialis]
MVEVYMCKARIYRHAGDLEASARIFEEVRQMDLADRFLNCVCVKSMLRIDDVQGGMEKALLFSKEPGSAEAANLHDMQCMWIESAVGRSYFRQKKYGMALKQFHETFKHFADIAEDQFDFHNYCLRKTTLKAYVAMLRMQDRLYSHKFYRRAAKDAIRIYLELFDSKVNGAKSGNEGDADGDDAGMSAEDKKKAKHKKKREAEAAAKKKAPATTTEAAKSGKPKKVDEDPDGDKLLQQDPMEQAVKLAKNLVLYAASDAASHVLTYDIFSRQGKLLHCIQALRKLWELAGHDVLHYKLVAPLSHFCFVMDLANESTSPAVREVVLSELAPILLGDDSSPAFESVAALRKAATEFVDKVERRLKECQDLPVIEVFYGLKCMKSAGRDCKGFLEAWKPQSVMALKECRKLLGYLSQEYGKETDLELDDAFDELSCASVHQLKRLQALGLAAVSQFKDSVEDEDDEDDEDEDEEDEEDEDEDEDGDAPAETDADNDAMPEADEPWQAQLGPGDTPFRSQQQLLRSMRVSWMRKQKSGHASPWECPGGDECKDLICFSLAESSELAGLGEAAAGGWLRRHGLEHWLRAVAEQCGMEVGRLLCVLHSAATGEWCAMQLSSFCGNSLQRLALILRQTGLPWAPCQMCHCSLMGRVDPGLSSEIALLCQWLRHPSSALQDWVVDCTARGRCTSCATGSHPALQESWRCLTCSASAGSAAAEVDLCSSCAAACHSGHDVVPGASIGTTTLAGSGSAAGDVEARAEVKSFSCSCGSIKGGPIGGCQQLARISDISRSLSL